MKIMHICLASHYTEGMTYQDNLLPLQNALDGHEVTIVSDCHVYKEGKLLSVPEEDRMLEHGIRLIRLKYQKILNQFVSSKIRKVSGLYALISSVKPDVILFHGVAGWEVMTVAKYKKENSVRLFIDSHEDFNNSAKNWLSRFILHKLFYRSILYKARPFVDKFLYLSLECRLFLKEMYGLEDYELEFYPLGGQIVEPVIKAAWSREIREAHGFAEDDVLIFHSGKLDKGKRTEEVIRALKNVPKANLKLIIAGSIPEDMEQNLQPLMSSDDRVIYVGWKAADDLVKYLCAADLYFQPGTQSATMQNALCCGTPVALYPYPSHKPYISNNGFWIETMLDFEHVFATISSDKEVLKPMVKGSYEIARDLLDYQKLAERLY